MQVILIILLLSLVILTIELSIILTFKINTNIRNKQKISKYLTMLHKNKKIPPDFINTTKLIVLDDDEEIARENRLNQQNQIKKMFDKE